MDVILIAVGVFVFLLLLSLRKPIYLSLIKTIHGEYSFRYVMKYKKYTKKKPHPYCFKDDFYYHILALNNALKCKTQYKSEQAFSFDDLDFSKQFKETIKEKGEPDCYTMSDEKDIPLRVLGFKSRMFHSNEKTLFYFCNEKYFMGEYVYSSLAENTPELIVEAMRKEFNPDIKYAKNFTVKDPSGNVLFFTDTGFFLSIKFFNPNNESVKRIIEYTTISEENKKDMHAGFGVLDC